MATNITENKIDLNDLVYISSKIENSQILNQFDILLVCLVEVKNILEKTEYITLMNQMSLVRFVQELELKKYFLNL